MLLVATVVPGRLAAKSRVQRGGRGHCAVTSSAETLVVEPKTKISFPGALLGQRCLGCGVRAKQLFGPLAVNVYAVALYAEEASLRTAQDANLLKLADAVPLTLCLVFARSVTPAQFTDALTSELATRSSDAETLEAFCALFRNKTLDAGTTVLLGSTPGAGLEVTLLRQPMTPPAPDATFASAAFARALCDIYLGERSIVPEAKATWAASVRALML